MVELVYGGGGAYSACHEMRRILFYLEIKTYLTLIWEKQLPGLKKFPFSVMSPYFI
jgi:hypothetical protein